MTEYVTVPREHSVMVGWNIDAALHHLQSDGAIDRAQLVAVLRAAKEYFEALSAAPSTTDAQDAARYRWLRSKTEWRTLGKARWLRVPDIVLPDGRRDAFAPDKLDAAIDAAMKRENDK